MYSTGVATLPRRLVRRRALGASNALNRRLDRWLGRPVRIGYHARHLELLLEEDAGRIATRPWRGLDGEDVFDDRAPRPLMPSRHATCGGEQHRLGAVVARDDSLATTAAGSGGPPRPAPRLSSRVAVSIHRASTTPHRVPTPPTGSR